MKALVLEKEFITQDIFILWLETEKLKKTFPGQFFMIQTEVTFLNRPFTPADVENNMLRFVIRIRGRGTEWLAKRKKGDVIEISGPWGNGVRRLKKKRIALVGGGTGIAPFLYFLKFFKKEDVHCFFGAKRKEELLFMSEFEFLTNNIMWITEDGSFGKKGVVTQFIKEEFDEIYACGPTEMLLALKNNVKSNSIYAFLEKEIHCGAGLCMGCGVKRKEGGYLRICTDGPVVLLKEVVIEP